MKANSKHVWSVTDTNTLDASVYPKADNLKELKEFIITGLNHAKVNIININMSKRYLLIVKVKTGVLYWSFSKIKNTSHKETWKDIFLRVCQLYHNSCSINTLTVNN